MMAAGGKGWGEVELAEVKEANGASLLLPG